MSLIDDYRRQLAWRDFGTAIDSLPPLEGSLVLDLGCAIGDQAALLAARGARVIGVDSNEELLAFARGRGLSGVEFQNHDLRALPALAAADGVWSSFSAAYFVDLVPVLRGWGALLEPGGWVALTEIDDLFGHEPLGDEAREALASYTDQARRLSRYDFSMGKRLRPSLEEAGFTVLCELDLADQELAFAGPASPEVLDAWRARFDRMKLLHEHCGARLGAIRDDFLACLARPDHRSLCRVRFCLARRPRA